MEPGKLTTLLGRSQVCNRLDDMERQGSYRARSSEPAGAYRRHRLSILVGGL